MEKEPADSTLEKLKSVFLVETAWEVCNQVGGIYTVIRSKVPAMTRQWGENYCLLGPLLNKNVSAEFDDIHDRTGPLGRAVARMENDGHKMKFGIWLVSGRPKTVLFDIKSMTQQVDVIRRRLESQYSIHINAEDELQNQVIALAEISTSFLKYLAEELDKESMSLITHCHEWMAALPILELKKSDLPVKTIFTTHATAIGRYVAMNDENFYSRLSTYNWEDQARYYNILAIAEIERYVGQACDVLTTVSEVTARECKQFFSRTPDLITPNGLNIKRFVAFHEVQNLHGRYKDVIHQFVMGHFFNSSPFNLDKTLYFFTSGRYEFRNKGFDITLEALEQLNIMMKEAKMDTTVVMFFITKRPSWSINPEVMQSRGVMEEIRKTCEAIQKQVGERLFEAAAESMTDFKLPDLNVMVEDYLRLKYRRILQSWKSDKWPIVTTHNLVDDINDEILQYVRRNELVNSPKDKVKVVYHPDFIDSTSPLFGIDYGEFVRGCHLGIFPSFYEPWGYTPLECIARGVPTITSDFSGFGDYINAQMDDHEEYGVYVLKRFRKKPEVAAKDLANMMFRFIKLTRRNRMVQRNRAEDLSEHFDWGSLVEFYNKAYIKSLRKKTKKSAQA
jgi:glycogen synthase